jgi:hypothetical protein
MGKYVTQNYLKRLGLENIKTFATRGVIIDAVKVFQAANKLKANAACKNACLDQGTLITEADLQAGLKMYNVTLREGDAVFIHTGWGDLFQQFPAQNALYNEGDPASASRLRHGSRRRRWSRSAPTPGRLRCFPVRTPRRPSRYTRLC